MHDDAPALCAFGNHRHDGLGPICNNHLQATRDDLIRLPGLAARLVDVLVPGPAGLGEKVATSKTGSPTSTNLGALSLIGPGSTDVRRDSRLLVPRVRRWSTVKSYTAQTAAGPQRRQVRTWHSEVITYGDRPDRACRCGEDHGTARARATMFYADDQVGVPPPAEWCDLWVRRCRALLAWPHGQAPQPGPGWSMTFRMDTGRRTAAGDRVLGPPVLRPFRDPARVAEHRQARLDKVTPVVWSRIAARQPAMLPAVAMFLAAQATYRAALADTQTAVANTVLGLRGDGPAARARVAAALTSRMPGKVRDTTETEWALRYGSSRNAATVEVDAHQLAEWLPFLADLDPAALVEMSVELRALVREIEYVLQETRDDCWLGRCPTELLDDEGEPTGRYCGAGLWQDPFRTRIECPRCHTITAEPRWEILAARIHHTWPIDLRRRYTLADRRAAEANLERRPACRGCERSMTIRWRETPAVRGVGRTFRIVGLVCPGGCLAGGTVDAA